MHFVGNLFKRAQIYTKLAEEQLELPFSPATVAPVDTPDMKAYKQFLKDIPTLSWNDIEEKLSVDFIAKPSIDIKSSFIKQEELAKLLIEKAFSETHSLSEANDKLLQIIYATDEFWRKTKKLMVEYYLDHINDTHLTNKEYRNIIETIPNLSDTYLRKAQANLIKQIIEFASNNPTEDSYRASQKILEELLTQSRKMDATFLWRLAKHLGPEYYGEMVSKINGQNPSVFVNNTTESKIPEIRHKSKYNTYDLSIVLQELRFRGKSSFDAPKFQQLIDKCDDEAKQYLRRLLYAYPVGKRNSNYFMLDEQMKPMNSEMKNIPFPSWFHIMWGWQESNSIRELWLPIFHDFGIVPVEMM